LIALLTDFYTILIVKRCCTYL